MEELRILNVQLTETNGDTTRLLPASQHLTVVSKYKSNALSAPSSNTAAFSDLSTALFAITHLPQGPSYPVLHVVAVKRFPNQAQRFFSVTTIAAEPRRVNNDKSTWVVFEALGLLILEKIHV